MGSGPGAEAASHGSGSANFPDVQVGDLGFGWASDRNKELGRILLGFGLNCGRELKVILPH